MYTSENEKYQKYKKIKLKYKHLKKKKINMVMRKNARYLHL